MAGTAQSVKATFLRIPHDLGGVPGVPGGLRTQNDFASKKIATTSTHTQEALNREWSGQYVYARWVGTATTDRVDIAFSKRTGGEVSTGVSAGNNASVPSNTLLVGAPLFSTEGWVHFQLPEWDNNEVGYLLHESTSNGTLWLIKGS